MNIIEREIAVRENMVSEDQKNREELQALKSREAELEAKITKTNVDQLKADIEELKTYLVKPEPAAALEAEESPIEDKPIEPDTEE